MSSLSFASIRRSARRFLLLGVSAAALVLSGIPGSDGTALAQEQEIPVLLTADELVYDEALGVVTASGNVELSHEDRILLADSVTYNERTKVVTASGNVRLLEPTGEVLFADYVELTDDLADGFADQVRVLLTDASRVAAVEGERTDDGRFLRLNRVVYSPCELCKEDPTRPPLWQIRAARVVHDKQAQNVYYRDATLELFGFPVAYTPYLSHPDPTVEQRSGILAPTFSLGGDRGAAVAVPYYWAIGPDQDATITLAPSTSDGILLGAEWRKRFESGLLEFDGSVINTDRPELADGVRVEEANQWRGHLFGTGRFALTDRFRTGFDIRRSSDRTYLREYDISDAEVLTSRAFLEGFDGRHYGHLSSYAFQELRPRTSLEQPLVLPELGVNLVGEPDSLWGGRWSLDAGLLGLHRDEGTDLRRYSTRLGWERELVSPYGLVTTISTGLRADYYDATVEPVPGTGPQARGDVSEARLVPDATVNLRYPVARQIGSVRQVVEPIVGITATPTADADTRLPNEDSLLLDIDRVTLFRPDWYSGIDRREGGARINYGVTTAFYGESGGYSKFFLGQSYRLTENETLPVGSGLNEDFTDYFASIEVVPNPYLDLLYNVQLDKDTLAPRAQTFYGSAGPAALRVNAGYNYRDDSIDVDGTPIPKRNYLNLGLSSQFTPNWSVSLTQSRNFEEEDPILSTGLVFTYADECFTFQAIGLHDNTDRIEKEGDTTIYFRLVFKNLGEFATPYLFGSPSDSDEG